MNIDNNQKFQVLIVGAGPVGLVAALYFEKFQIKTLLIEKSSEAYTYPRAIGIDDQIVRILQAILPKEQIKKFTVDDPDIQYFGPQGKYSRITGMNSMKILRLPKGGTFYQPELESILRDEITQGKYVTFLEKCEFLSYKEEEGMYTVVLSHEGKEKSINTHYILGCDGGQSAVRKISGIKFQQTDQGEDWLVVDIKDDAKIQENIQKIATTKTNNLPCVTINVPNGIRRFEIKLDESVSVDTNETELALSLLKDFFKDTNPHIIRARVYRRNFCIASDFRKNNIFIAGDAAHLVPPFGGQGMCSGIRDVTNLCWKLSEVIKNEIQEKILDTYFQERLVALQDTMKFIRLMGKRVKASFHMDKLIILIKTINAIKMFLALIKPHHPDKNIIENTISIKTYLKIKPLAKVDSDLIFSSPLAGYLMPYTIISQEKLGETCLDEEIAWKWCVVGAPMTLEKMDKNLLKDTPIQTYIPINVDNIVNKELLDFIYKENIIDLMNDGYCFILRPDMYIYACVKIDELESAIHKLKNNYFIS